MMQKTARTAPHRASYARAIDWIAENDDAARLEPFDGDEIIASVTATLVADLFGRTDAEVGADLRKALKRRST